jgi:hypothetical protein
MAKRPNSTPTTAYGVRTLQIDPECKGRDVWELQIKLLGWGSGTDNEGIGNFFEPMKVNGTYDRRTRDAVMRFQKALKLPVDGIVDSATFSAIDREAALYPIFVHQMKCPCVKGENDGPILCRCEKHDEKGKCTGFGKARFGGKFLLDGKKLADNTDISGEKLDLYDMKEYPGVDKAVLWAVRGLMRRAGVTRIAVLAGYRCWEDNYHHTDEQRWRHRQLTFHLGKAIEFHIDGDGTKCTDTGADLTKPACPECTRVRGAAIAKCGFQLRWQEPDRVSVAEGSEKVRQPANQYAVHVNTVRRLEREDDDFVKTFYDSTLPLFAGSVKYSFPVDLGEGTDPRVATSNLYYSNIETASGGWYPVGASRSWHGGVHLYAAENTEVRAVADGEIVGFRVGEKMDKKAFGSRNFVLMRHEFEKKKFYSLYYHLDAEVADGTAKTRWRREIAIRAKKHVEAITPCPFLVVVDVTLPDGVTVKKRFKPKEQEGLAPGELVLAASAVLDAKTIDDSVPDGTSAVKLTEPADTYVFTKLEYKLLAKLLDAEAGLAGLLKNQNPAGMANPIGVRGGEVIGKIGAAATDEKAATLGTFVHVEIFSDQAFLTGDGWQQIDAGAAAKVPDRRAIVEEMIGKKLLSPPADKVLLDQDVQQPEQDVYRELARAVILRMPSEWALDWKAALRGPDCLGFIDDRGALGDKFNDYRWWEEVKKKFALPDPNVFHYHPIAAVIAMAHA